MQAQLQHPKRHPLTPSEMVPDTILRELAKQDAGCNRGELSAVHQAYLAMYLPEICGELLANRAAERANETPAAIIPFHGQIGGAA